MSPEARASKSVLRRAYDALEGAAGPGLEAVAGNRALAELTGTGRRVVAEWKRRGSGVSASVLHAWNLPAHTDMQRLVRHIARLEARLRTLEHDLEGRDAGRAAGASAVGDRTGSA